MTPAWQGTKQPVPFTINPVNVKCNTCFGKPTRLALVTGGKYSRSLDARPQATLVISNFGVRGAVLLNNLIRLPSDMIRSMLSQYSTNVRPPTPKPQPSCADLAFCLCGSHCFSTFGLPFFTITQSS
jgi:hypothetical protein